MDYNAIRRKSRRIRIGNIYIGADQPIAVQSMTNTDPHDYDKTLSQVRELEAAGCDIVRLAIPDLEAVRVISKIKEYGGISVPLVADIHYDHKLALECVSAGVDKIRINPGNIGDDKKVELVAKKCAEHGVPIRIGVNSGSLERHILEKHGAPTAQALAESALYHASLLEKNGFFDIVLAVKSSDVATMINATRIIADATDYPIHLGVTEAGTPHDGVIKSAIGIGSLICDGIGDTIRVSLTAPPALEVKEGRALLRNIGIGGGIRVTSCPTCGRTKIDLIELCEAFEERIARGDVRSDRPLHVAIMGCAVNGPGEAREADIGIAGGVGEGLLFRHGEIIRKIPQNEIIDQLIKEINDM